jgi:hypothetical protein
MSSSGEPTSYPHLTVDTIPVEMMNEDRVQWGCRQKALNVRFEDPSAWQVDN